MSTLHRLLNVISCSFLASIGLIGVANAAGPFEPPSFPGFGHPTFLPLNGFAFGVATGDINGDGHLDLVVTGSSDNQISLLFGHGDGTFEPDRPFPVGHRSADVVLLDLDDDGDLDMAVASAVSGVVLILRNDGTGSFTVIQTIGVGVQTQSIAAGDLNGDGLIDLAASNAGSNTVSVLFDQGGGHFSPAVNHTVGNFPTDVAIGDLNNDGLPDLAVPNAFSNTTSVLYNDGQGGFPTSITLPGFGGTDVAIFDADQDGDDDLFVAQGIVIVIFENLGDGELAPYGLLPQRGLQGAWNNLAVADFNLDGLPDLAATMFSNVPGVGGRVIAMTGVRNMLFHKREDHIVDGEVDGDDLSILLTQWGDIGFTIDFNHDGTVNGADLVLLLVNWGEAPIFKFWVAPTTSASQAIVTGDFNEDGAPDLAVTLPNTTSEAAVYLNRMSTSK